jgi:hypothetical protein
MVGRKVSGGYLDLFSKFLLFFIPFPFNFCFTLFESRFHGVFGIIEGTVDLVAYTFCSIESLFTGVASVFFGSTTSICCIASGGVEIISSYERISLNPRNDGMMQTSKEDGTMRTALRDESETWKEMQGLKGRYQQRRRRVQTISIIRLVHRLVEEDEVHEEQRLEVVVVEEQPLFDCGLLFNKVESSSSFKDFGS